MKTIALLGGTTYHATAVCYMKINEAVQTHIGGAATATLLTHSSNHTDTQRLFNIGVPQLESNTW